MGLFGIGLYQPLPNQPADELPLMLGSGFPNTLFSLHEPFAGQWGGQYGFLVDTSVRDPKNVALTPAPMIGLDSVGTPVVRGYPQMTWSYSTLRPDYWYYLLWLHRLSAMTPPGFQYLVLAMYPDLGTGEPTQQTARWDPPTFSQRTVGAFYGVTLRFTYLGQAQILSGTPVIIVK